MPASLCVFVVIIASVACCGKEPGKRTSAPLSGPPLASLATSASAIAASDGGVDPGKSTHTSSATLASLSERVTFVERYVKFRRRYEALEFAIEYLDDTSLVPGPSSTSCDIRLYAKVPAEQVSQWTAGLDAWPVPADLGWTSEIPNAPLTIERFVWYRQPESVFGGDKLVGIAQGGASSTEVLYRLVCARN